MLFVRQILQPYFEKPARKPPHHGHRGKLGCLLHSGPCWQIPHSLVIITAVAVKVRQVISNHDGQRPYLQDHKLQWQSSQL